MDEYTDGEEVISPFLPTRKVETRYATTNAAKDVGGLKNWLAPYAKLSPDMKAIYREKLKNYRLSASALTTFIDVVYAGPQEFFKNYILAVPREPETEALAFGNLVHIVFEAVTSQHLDDEAAVALFLAELEKRELPAAVSQKIREKGPGDLLVALGEFGDILRQGKAEVNLGPENLSIEGVPVTGKVDHIIVDDQKKTLEIYDFKTGGYHKEKWQSHATLYKYMLQLGFYKLLLNNSPTYAKYKVEKAHILFVAPDQDGLVYDKVYEFNTEDEKSLVNLIKQVYGLISSLEFLDRPDIFVQPDSSRGLKDIKAFIELLL